MSKRICSVEDCNNPHKALGLCQVHYNRRKSAGLKVEDLPGERWLPIAGYEGFYEPAARSKTGS